MKTLSLIMLSLLAAGPAVEVQQLDGSKTSGDLIELSADSLEIQLADGKSSVFPAKDIISVRPVQPSDIAEKQPVTKELFFADGSRLLTADMLVSSRNAELMLPRGARVEIGRSALKGVRLLPTDPQSDDDPLKEKWDELAKEHTGGDAIVLNREGMLTVQEVVIHGVTADGVKIQLDDITTTVNPSKLYGLLFYQRAAREFPAPLCVVHLNDNSTLVARSIKMNNGQTRVTVLTGTEIPIPFDRITKLDFAAGNIQFLDELKPARITWTPVLKSAIAVDDLSLVYAPRMNQSFQGDAIQLEEDQQPQVYSRGIAVHATSELLYQLPSGFRQLQMRVGIAPESLGTCTAKLQIIGDQKILFEKEFNDETPPEDIALNISGVSRLKIVVDANDGEDFGDVLHLCQARLLK
ncbi:NPCBM/NEW2 domain-containing protein [Bremerella sp. P1]|uniref:NPCBM/NEW2 domain-containing protein n=1 Tax=Bremerella sp. P1 TaxID=3026424 RepID=UPI0023687DE5|nr:NPCBM/NEW2 domain-containing protein [Bremerella sp. P1]WDI42350.1 NPCBM/NEW2 domain-containing protein [Bremerella sp. P1]